MKAWSEMTPEERTAACVELVEVKDLSYSGIAKLYGVSRSAVAGMLDRHKKRGGVLRNRRVVDNTWTAGATKRVKLVKKPVVPLSNISIRANKSAGTPATVARANKDKPTASAPVGLSVVDLNDHTCRWPLGDGPYTFCGAPTALSPFGWKVYCTEHNAIAYRPFERKDRVSEKPSRKTLSFSR